MLHNLQTHKFRSQHRDVILKRVNGETFQAFSIRYIFKYSHCNTFPSHEKHEKYSAASNKLSNLVSKSLFYLEKETKLQFTYNSLMQLVCTDIQNFHFFMLYLCLMTTTLCYILHFILQMVCQENMINVNFSNANLNDTV